MQPGILNYSYLAHLSQPSADRQIYRAIRRHRVRSILEIGVGYARRAQRMIAVASQFQADADIRYTGIDLFEDRPDNDLGITFKLAYKLLKRLDAKVRLIPGDPFTALARMANSITDTDMIVIAADQDPESLERAWCFFPRMIHENSFVFQEYAKTGNRSLQFQRLEPQQVHELARVGHRQTRIAA